jgi:hypothetical protein
LQIANAASQPVNPDDHENVTLWRKSNTVGRSARPLVVVPLRFSDWITSHPAARASLIQS